MTTIERMRAAKACDKHYECIRVKGANRGPRALGFAANGCDDCAKAVALAVAVNPADFDSPVECVFAQTWLRADIKAGR